MSRRLIAVGAALLLACVSSAGAQQRADDVSRGLDLERAGRFDSAAVMFRRALGARPGDPSALLGLERVLDELHRGGEVLAPAKAAVAAAPSPAAYSVLVRAYVAAGAGDSARATVLAWSGLQPGDVTPYRELVQALQRARNRPAAREAVRFGRERLGRQEILAYDMAQLMAAEGDWAGAAREWLAAARELPGYRQTALAALTPAPDRARADVLATMAADRSLPAALLGATLKARWGNPDAAVLELVAALPADRARAIGALNEFADQLRALPTAQRARGVALEEVAARSTGDMAARARVQAAQAFQLAGDNQSSRRLLGAVAADTRRGQLAASAVATMIQVLVADGKVADAEARLQEARARISIDEWESLRRDVALGWIAAGDLRRSHALVGADSSVAGLDVRGRIAIFEGDLQTGVQLLRAAGPFAGSRETAASRTALLALVQPIEDDSVPELGAALLLLQRADTARAAGALEQLGVKLTPEKGGAELLFLAGELRHALGENADAERLFRQASVPAATGTAPAASLALARILLDAGRKPEAVSTLERLILTYPTSAVVPQARRALDEAKGMVPAS